MLTINKLYIKTHKNRTQILSRFSCLTCEIMLTSHAKRFSIEIFSCAMLPRWRTIIVTIRLLKPKIPSSAPPLSLSLSFYIHIFLTIVISTYRDRSPSPPLEEAFCVVNSFSMFGLSCEKKKKKKNFRLSNNEVTRRQNSHES
jgi:hypothetical protein